MLHGSINHISITVSDRPAAMKFEVAQKPLAERRYREMMRAVERAAAC